MAERDRATSRARAAARSRARRGWEFTDLPQLQGPRGWEFTGSAARRRPSPGAGGRRLVLLEPLPEAPEADAWPGRRRGRGAEPSPTASSCCRSRVARERHAELVEPHLGTSSCAADDSSPRQRRRLGGRRVRLRPARRAGRGADPAHRGRRTRRHDAEPARAGRARGGRRGRGLGAVPLRRPRRRDAAQHRRRARRRPEREPALRLRARSSTRSSWIFGAQRAEVARDGRWTGSRSASAPRNGKVRPETHARRRGRRGQGHRRLRAARPPAHRLRHDAGARRAEHDVATSRSAASSPAARARCGAG